MTQLIQPTRILVVGGGGREHALAWKLGAEPGVNEVTVAPGSDAIAREARVRVEPGVDPPDPTAVVALARERAAELVVIGPEAPLAAGVADALHEAGIPVFGPTAAAAQLETSKTFCHEIAAEAGVPMARSASFRADDVAAARDWARDEAVRPGSTGVVVKADGLAGGKGVVVCDAADEAVAAIETILTGGAERILVEERLSGSEASVIAICAGRSAVALPPARDHKRLLDGDRGPNTGGMGAYAPLPDLSEGAMDDLLDLVHRPILATMSRRGIDYRGFLYAGLMLTAGGPRLLEFNVRLGDPEAQVLLPQLASPLAPFLLAAAHGGSMDLWNSRLPTIGGFTVGVVLASAGYPGESSPGERISGLEAAAALGAVAFHSGTRWDQDRWVTAGGRVLTVVARGRDLAEASDAAERAAEAISWPGMQRRHDIGVLPGSPVGAGR